MRWSWPIAPRKGCPRCARRLTRGPSSETSVPPAFARSSLALRPGSTPSSSRQGFRKPWAASRTFFLSTWPASRCCSTTSRRRWRTKGAPCCSRPWRPIACPLWTIACSRSWTSPWRRIFPAAWRRRSMPNGAPQGVPTRSRRWGSCAWPVEWPFAGRHVGCGPAPSRQAPSTRRCTASRRPREVPRPIGGWTGRSRHRRPGASEKPRRSRRRRCSSAHRPLPSSTAATCSSMGAGSPPSHALSQIRLWRRPRSSRVGRPGA
jgi:hypothetical protein